jgi:hypothetical protein
MIASAHACGLLQLLSLLWLLLSGAITIPGGWKLSVNYMIRSSALRQGLKFRLRVASQMSTELMERLWDRHLCSKSPREGWSSNPSMRKLRTQQRMSSATDDGRPTVQVAGSASIALQLGFQEYTQHGPRALLRSQRQRCFNLAWAIDSQFQYRTCSSSLFAP